MSNIRKVLLIPAAFAMIAAAGTMTTAKADGRAMDSDTTYNYYEYAPQPPTTNYYAPQPPTTNYYAPQPPTTNYYTLQPPTTNYYYIQRPMQCHLGICY